MADTTDFRNGFTMLLDGELFSIVEFQHVKPGKGGAFVRTRLKNVKTGAVIDRTFRSGDKVEEVRVEKREMQYLYSEGEVYYFMDLETYDQIGIQKEVVGKAAELLKENENAFVLTARGSAIGVELPNFVQLRVSHTEPGVRGDTATGAVKPAVLETGAQVQVPLFVNEGDLLKIDTRTPESTWNASERPIRPPTEGEAKVNESTIRKLLELFEGSDIEEMEWEHSFWRGTRIRFSRSRSRKQDPSPPGPPPAPAHSPCPEEASSGPAESPASSSGGAKEEEGLHLITAPMVGTFYRASAPESEPFVHEGDRVKAGQTICIIEAMKIMNEIPADVEGEIVEILVEDADPVEFGQPLVRIRPS